MAEEEAPVPLSKWLMAMIKADFSSTQKNPRDNRKYFCTDCLGDPLTESERKKCKAVGHKVLVTYKASGQYSFLKDKMVRLMRGRRPDIDASGVAFYSINNKSVLFIESCRGHIHQFDENNKCVSSFELCLTCGRGLTAKGSGSGKFCSILCKYLFPLSNLDRAKVLDYARLRKTTRAPSLKRKRVTQNNSQSLVVIGGDQNNKFEIGETSAAGEGRHPLKIIFKRSSTNPKDANGWVLKKEKTDNDHDDDDNNNNNQGGNLLPVITKTGEGTKSVKAKANKENLSLRKRSRKGIPHRAPFF